MKREDVTSIFEGATDAQVQAIMDLYGVGVENAKRGLDDQSKRADDAERRAADAERRAADAEKRLAESTMSAEELARAQAEAAAAKEREFTIKSNRLDAKAVFVDAGLDASFYEQLLDIVVCDDAARSVSSARAIVDQIGASAKAAVDKAQAGALANMPKPSAMPQPSAITKSDFMKMSWAEQEKLVRETPGILETLK